MATSATATRTLERFTLGAELLRRDARLRRGRTLHVDSSRGRTWKVPADECEPKLGTVIHRPSGRTLTYGQLAASASKLPAPDPGEIGTSSPQAPGATSAKDTPRYNIDALMHGAASLRDRTNEWTGCCMPQSSARRSWAERFKSTRRQGSAAGARRPSDRGHPAVLLRRARSRRWGGIAVIADNSWAALQGRPKAQCWSGTMAPTPATMSAKYHDELRATSHKPCKVIRNAGDVEAEFAQGGKIVEADYYVAAARTCVVGTAGRRRGLSRWQGDGVGSYPGSTKLCRARWPANWISPAESVTCHVTLSWRRVRSKVDGRLCSGSSLPVESGRTSPKGTWSREDDIKFDYYNAVAAMYMKAALGKDGKPTAWLQRSTFPPSTSIFKVDALYGDPGHLAQGWTDIPFDISNLRVENGPAKAHVRIGWARSVAKHLSCVRGAVFRR